MNLVFGKTIKYQVEAVDKLVNATKDLLKTKKSSLVLIFKSPTGSGKTVMTANYIDKLIKEIDNPLCFLWISVGKGELHKQSKNKLEQIFKGQLKVSLLEEEFFGYRNSIDQNEIVVINWESINNKNKLTGEWTNIAMRSGEKINFRSVLANTKDSLKIITIIDESHLNSTTERAEELKQVMNSDLLFEMSATPKIHIDVDDIANNTAKVVKVEIQDVIDAEMIKKKLLVNEGLELDSTSSIDRSLLQTVFEKRNKLKNLYEENTAKVNPLVIIQLPNAQEGEVRKETIINFLKDKDITIENKKLAIWLSGEKKEEKSNLENITDNNNQVEFLIFKQALDTGWDCPRAIILLKFREIKSEIFGRQTLGRILRMPEQKFYVNDELNQAYLYTDIEDSTLKIIDKEFDFPESNIDTIRLFRNKNYQNIQLKYFFKVVKKKPVTKTKITQLFIENFVDKYGIVKQSYEDNQNFLSSNSFKFDVTELTQHLVKSIIETEALLSKDEFTISGTEDMSLDEERTEILFNRLLNAKSTLLGSDKEILFEIFKENIYAIFHDYIIRPSDMHNLIVNSQKLVLLNYEKFFNSLLVNVIERYKENFKDELIESSIIESVFEIQPTMNCNEKLYEEVHYEKYVYDKCYLQKDRYNPERHFETFIQQNLSNISWWYKNSNNGNSFFGIDYIYDGQQKMFYPDYLICFNDNRIGIFETKDKDDPEGKTYTKSKAERLQEYIKQECASGKNIFGGIVANFALKKDDPAIIKINNKIVFDIDNFSDWNDLIF